PPTARTCGRRMAGSSRRPRGSTARESLCLQERRRPRRRAFRPALSALAPCPKSLRSRRTRAVSTTLASEPRITAEGIRGDMRTLGRHVVCLGSRSAAGRKSTTLPPLTMATRTSDNARMALGPELVVDADGHVCEPPDLWERNLPARFRDRALRLRWNAETGYDEAWVEDWLITDRGLVGLGNAGT